MWKKIWENPGLFKGISWGITALIVFGLLGATLYTVLPTAARVPATTTTLATKAPEATANASLPTLVSSGAGTQAIVRQVTLKTDISSKTTFDMVEYTVQRGDSVFSIAKQFNIKPETVLFANYDILQDSPDSLRVGQVLKIPAVDGVYYQWQDGDTLDSIAAKFSANVDDILNFPGNKFDLTNPVIKQGDYVMVPGGSRAFVQWIIPTIARGKSGTASVGQASCSGGAVGSGAFVWPAPNHYLSGNDYSASHLGIDIAAVEGTTIFAADSGVVVLAAGGWNHGYGNVIMIDHGNGYTTLYGHLSQINVATCQSVSAGEVIGLAGNTGNSFGAHLHFEVRLNGGFVNPWYVLPK
jgi:murein DD-endopeptidase MepM/ murein hydrolase activator NlpD